MRLDKSQKRKEMIEKFKQLSPFELKDELIRLAKEREFKGMSMMLNAGRGNPNWTASTPRQAFFTLGQFAVEEAKRVWDEGDLAGMPKKEGVWKRFHQYAQRHQGEPGIELLEKVIQYGIEEHHFDPDIWVYELVDGIIGDHYPVPDRMLCCVESVVHEYIMNEMGAEHPKEISHDLFAVEGGTAAMCYIFDSLVANHLLHVGDRIALMVPIFTPYLEIPQLSRYNFQITEVFASKLNEKGQYTWQYPKEELDKIGDPEVKAVFVVNPSNPPAVAINEESMEYLQKIVREKNPSIMIITDDVYGTFVDHFRSLMVNIPENTIGVYSYSKYFGVTGWRLGIIALAHDNIFDRLLKQLPADMKDDLVDRYGLLTTEPEQIKFIDRLVADSRQVALNHTAGLSTPQQIQMAIFSVFALLDQQGRYKNQTKDICRRREKLLYQHLGDYPSSFNQYSSSYYTKIDLMIWAKLKYGNEFVQYLKDNYDSVDILFRLAEEYGIVLLNGNGFDGPEWSIRVSLANLRDEDYVTIGKAINDTFEDYSEDWQQNRRK